MPGTQRRARLSACAALAALSLAASLAPAPAAAQAVAGAWHGVLVAGPTALRVVVRGKEDGKGGYAGEMVSLDQGGARIPLSDVKLAGGHFTFAIPPLRASFDGQWDAAKGAWTGQFKQGVALPLTLDKGEFPAAPPSPPKPATRTAAPPGKTVEGVTVTAQSQDVKTDIDRRSYDITKDLQTTSGSVADALRNIPSVQVDVQGNVSLRGDSNVTIMIDGKPSSLFSGPARGQVLQNLPAGAFERVEVMTNPSAAFRPDGSAGIINLIPKSARALGRSGSVRVITAGQGRNQLGLSGYSVSKTLTLTGDLVLGEDHQKTEGRDERAVLDPASGQVLNDTTRTGTGLASTIWFARGAADYDPDAKTRFSAELRGSGVSVTSHILAQFDGEAPATLAPEAFTRHDLSDFDRVNVAGTGTWRRKFAGDGHDLVVSFTQERTTTRSTHDEDLDSPTPLLIPSFVQQSRNDLTQDQSHLKADYTRPLPGDAKLKLGYELQVDDDDFDNTGQTGPTAGAETPNPTLIDQFRFQQTVNSAYVTYQRPFGPLTVLGGLRIEDTLIDLHDITSAFRGSSDDTHLYPSLHLAWKLDDRQQLTASFSERIQRPQPTDYNPFRTFIDPFNFRSGNPDLKPQQTQSYEAGYEYRGGGRIYLVTAYYRDNQRGVTDVVDDLGGGVLLTTKANLASSRSGGLELVASGQVMKTLTVNLSGNLGWTEIDPSGLGFTNRRSAFTPSARGVINWQPTAKDLFQIQGSLIGKRLTPQGYHEATGLVNLGYRHKFNDDWSLFATERDALASFGDTLVLDTPALRQRVETHVNIRAVFVGLSYSFGGGRRRDQGFDYGTPPS